MVIRVLGQLPPRNIAPKPNSKANPKPNPNRNRGAIFLGGNCRDTGNKIPLKEKRTYQA